MPLMFDYVNSIFEPNVPTIIDYFCRFLKLFNKRKVLKVKNEFKYMHFNYIHISKIYYFFISFSKI
jgi:hypothetical protein